jgi:putative transport protein
VYVLFWLAKQPFVLLFLVVAAGFAVGRVEVKGIGPGDRSSLVTALAISPIILSKLPAYVFALFER